MSNIRLKRFTMTCLYQVSYLRLYQVSYLRLRDEVGVCLSYCCKSTQNACICKQNHNEPEPTQQGRPQLTQLNIYRPSLIYRTFRRVGSFTVTDFTVCLDHYQYSCRPAMCRMCCMIFDFHHSWSLRGKKPRKQKEPYAV